ncbi:MAG: DNA primase [Deferribacteres bacterium]|nr:DNA primase [Deferribacteres bacterium]
MPFSDRALDEIKDRIDIVDLISDYVHLKKTGQNWKGLCPFHSEKTPSFTVSPAKQIFHCFGCGSGGDIFTFLVRYENLTFPEALRMLASRAGVTLEEARKSAAGAGEKERLLDMHRHALEFFRHNLAGNQRAAEYLGSRGIGTGAQKAFSLGYAPKSWNGLLSYLGRRGYKPEAVNKAGLAAKGRGGYYDTFRDRIIFPIYDLKGDVVAFGGRSIDGSEPKYLNSPETPIFNKRRVLYGLHRAKNSIRETGRVLFMEGYLDVITAHVHGFPNAVAPLGTAFTQEHGKLIKRFTENVVIVFDSDPAGIKAAKNAAGILFESGLDVRVLSLPAGEDPDGFLRNRGREAFAGLLEHPLSIIEFYMMQGGDKRLTAREAIETISRVQDKVLQGEYVKMLSEKLGINEVFVMEELRKKTGRTGKSYKTAAPGAQARPAPASRPLYEEYIIRILLQMPGKAGEVFNVLSEDDFRDEAARGIFRRIREGTHGLNELISMCGDSERDLLTRISLADDFEEPEKVLSDCIKRLKDNKRRLLLQEIQKKIKDAELKKDFDLLRNLQRQQQEILSRRAIEK